MSFIFNPSGGGGGTPGGASTQIQVNNAGSFAGYADFSYITGTNTLNVGNITGSALSMTVKPLAPTGVLVAGSLNFLTQNAVAANTSGGAMNFTTGNSLGSGVGATIQFTAGNSVSNTGGSVYFQSGTSSGSSGGEYLAMGGRTNSLTGSGGNAAIRGGVYGPNEFGGANLVAGGGISTQAGDALISGGSASFTIGGQSGNAYLIAGLSSPADAIVGGSAYILNGLSQTGLRVSDNGASLTMAFYGVSPIVRPTTGGASAVFVANAGTGVNDASTFDGYTISKLVKALRNLGLLT